MQTETLESWKGQTVRIHTFPVRRIDTRDSAPDSYVATVDSGVLDEPQLLRERAA
jgi:hypothetical protein